MVIDNIHYKKDNKDSIQLKSNGKILGYIAKSFDAVNNKEKSVLTYELIDKEYVLKEEIEIDDDLSKNNANEDTNSNSSALTSKRNNINSVSTDEEARKKANGL